VHHVPTASRNWTTIHLGWWKPEKRNKKKEKGKPIPLLSAFQKNFFLSVSASPVVAGHLYIKLINAG
jgi:hypothetical protein